MEEVMNRRVFLPADILIPRDKNMGEWSVIACDQFSSEPEYWNRVGERCANEPSTLHMVVPEAYLESIELSKVAQERNTVMDKYLADGIFETVEDSYIYVEREVTGGIIRRGLVGAIDLDAYEYTKGTTAPIRASENTVIARIPPRVEVRKNAALELPHVMVLIDDPSRKVIEPLTERKADFEKLYDFELMEGGGKISGWRITGETSERVGAALDTLAQREIQMVIGDGNHSLASAKACWDELKKNLSDAERETHPARFALVELNNVYDEGIVFEPIHRVVFGIEPEKLVAVIKEKLAADAGMTIKLVWESGSEELNIPAQGIGALVGSLGDLIEEYISNGGTIDYIHDDKSACEMGMQTGNLAILLPAMDKADLFKTVETDGVFPKKSFSIGHARDKRYYLECKKIK